MFGRKLRVSILFTFILFIFYSNTFPQKKYNFEHLSIPEGLSNASVWDILQDKYGFLWIATADGLNRYDGYNFKIYKNDPDDPKSLSNNFIYSMLIDEEGNLWAGTGGGLAKFNPANETFQNFLPDSSRSDEQLNTIIHLIEDGKKRLWLATANGIVSFDMAKQKFEKAFIKEGENSVDVTGGTGIVMEASSGEIYSDYFYKGLIKYNEKIKAFELVDISSNNSNVFKNILMFNLYEDKTGKIWISAENGFYNYDPQTKILNEIDLFKKQNRTDIWTNSSCGVYQDDKGFLWVATIKNGIYRYNMKTNEVIALSQNEFPISVRNSDGFWKFFRDDFGILWIATQNNGLLKLDFQKEPFKRFAIPIDKTKSNGSLYIYSLFNNPEDENLLWLGADDGLIKYNLEDKSFSKFNNEKENTKSLPGNVVQSIQRGSTNELWLGTDKGLSLFNAANNTFTNYNLNEKNSHYDVVYNFINNISLDDYGNLWIASGNNGIIKFDTKTKTKRYIPHMQTRHYSLKLINFIDSLNNAHNALSKITEVGDYQNLKKDFTLNDDAEVMIVSVGEGLRDFGMADFGWLQDSKSDTVWAQKDYFTSFYLSGDYKNRINADFIKLKKGNYTLKYFSDDSHSYAHWNADAPVDSTLWGIQIFDLSNAKTDYYKNLIAEAKKAPCINSAFINKVEYQNDGTVLIGTSSGLFLYDIRKNIVESLQDDPKLFRTRNLKQIVDLFVDKDRIVWIATNGGLIKYNQDKKEFKILYDKDGLPSNYIAAIEEDAYGNLWLSTLNGICKFNKDVDNPIFINYDVKDGLQGYTFNRRASFRSASGDLFFAGQNGFNAFHSSNINKQLPKINITQLKISNELVLPNSENSPLTKSILDTKEIELGYSQNSISFDFTAIHFSRPEKNQYAYRLEGFDKHGWIYDNRRFATYTNLPPGDYVFRVKGSNGDGVWNEAGTSINIKVNSPWWRTVWAYIGYVLFFGLVVFGVDRIQRRRILSKEKVSAQIREAELRAQIAEKESERKSFELEEARKLQLSMLPTEIPQLPNLSIAVYMKTATEVGGDYYDFHLHLDGTLTVILGDATGHGMMSGMMVSIMKSLFMSDRTNKELKPFFENASAAIKDMRLGRLMMALSCVQIKNNKLITSNAGMPPLFIYRNNSQTIEEVVANNMPLGAMKGIAYDVKEFIVERGDTLLMMSDGFAELKNEDKEMYGYKRARNLFEETAKKEPEEIVHYLNEEGKLWTNDKELEDDVTFVVIKVK